MCVICSQKHSKQLKTTEEIVFLIWLHLEKSWRKTLFGCACVLWKEKEYFIFHFFKNVFVFWPCPWHVEVPGPEIELPSQQWPEPQQWQHQIPNPLCYEGTHLFSTCESYNPSSVTVICSFHQNQRMEWLLAQNITRERRLRNWKKIILHMNFLFVFSLLSYNLVS